MFKTCEMKIRALHFSSISCTSVTFPLVKTVGIRRLKKVGGSLDVLGSGSGRGIMAGGLQRRQDTPKGTARLSQ